jgi:hypothetical protein
MGGWKWTYEIHEFGYEEDMIRGLNQLGDDGWSLAAMLSDARCPPYRCLVKRPFTPRDALDAAFRLSPRDDSPEGVERRRVMFEQMRTTGRYP